MLACVIDVFAQSLVNRIRNDIGNRAFSLRALNKHHVAVGIGIPTHHGTVIAVVSHQCVDRIIEAIFPIAAYLDCRHRLGRRKLDKHSIGRMVFATVGGELHGRIVIAVCYRLEQGIGTPRITAVDTVEDTVSLFNGHGKTDGRRIERTGHEPAYVHIANIERTGRGHHIRSQRIINHRAGFTIAAIQSGCHHNLFSLAPISNGFATDIIIIR